MEIDVGTQDIYVRFQFNTYQPFLASMVGFPSTNKMQGYAPSRLVAPPSGVLHNRLDYTDKD